MYADVLDIDGAAALITQLINSGSLGFMGEGDDEE